MPDLPSGANRLNRGLKMSQRLTIKGQVTVPKNVRDFLGLTSGSSAVEFIIDDDGSVRVRKAAAASRRTSLPTGRDAAAGSTDRCTRILGLLSGCYV